MVAATETSSAIRFTSSTFSLWWAVFFFSFPFKIVRARAHTHSQHGYGLYRIFFEFFFLQLLCNSRIFYISLFKMKRFTLFFIYIIHFNRTHARRRTYECANAHTAYLLPQNFDISNSFFSLLFFFFLLNEYKRRKKMWLIQLVATIVINELLDCLWHFF